MNHRGIFRQIVFCSLGLVLAFSVRDVRAQVASGTIVGTARDSSGAVVPNAKITCTNVATGVARNVVAGNLGAYTIPGLPVGTYDLQASAPGFKNEVRKGVTVTVGASVAVNFTLSVGAVEESVIVSAEPPQVNTTDASLGGLVGDTTIRELPLNGRDWLQLATLQAGVVGGLGQQSPSSANNSRAARGNGEALAVAGARPTSNVFVVDNLIVNDYANGSPGSGLGVNLGVDAIQEFRVLTNEYSAQYGRTSGGVVNAVYKSGTNEFHGGAFGFLRNSALDARNFFDYPTKPAFRRIQFGGSAGGPIKRDKTFIYGNYESLREVQGLSESSNTLSLDARQGIVCANSACTSTTTVPIVPAIKPYLAVFPLPNGPANGDTAKYNFGAALNGIEHYTVVKLDHNISDQTMLSGSFQFDNTSIDSPDAFNQKRIGSPSRHYNTVINLQHAFGPSLLNNARIGVSRTHATDSMDTTAINPIASDKSLGFIPGSPVGIIAVAGPDSTSGGLGASGADIYNYTSFQFGDDLSWIKGKHNLKFGAAVERVRDNLHSVASPLGEWDFDSVTLFLQGIPGSYTADIPGTNDIRALRTTYAGLYFQDDIAVRPNLKVNVGVRYEFLSPLTEAFGRVAVLKTLDAAEPTLGGNYFNNPTKKNFAPRVGIAWDPTGSGKTSVRAGYGIYDMLPLPYLMVNRTNGAPFFKSGIIDSPPPSTFPTGANALLGETGLRASYVEPNPPRAYMQQWNLTVQRQLTTSAAVTLGYVGSHGVHIPQGVDDFDMASPAYLTKAPDGHLAIVPGAPRINPNWGRIPATVWDDTSSYNALVVDFNQRMSHGLLFSGSYTWSKSIDLGSSTFSANENINTVDNPYPFIAALNRGPSDHDIAHNFVISSTWDIPTSRSFTGVPKTLLSGWELGGIFTAHTGPPFSVSLRTDVAGTGTTRQRQSGGQKPNFNPLPGCSVNAVNPGNPSNYIKAECFSPPAAGTIGNLGRNTLRAPGLVEFDPSISKTWSLGGELAKLQFRAEAFNLFNHANFQIGKTTLFNGNKVISSALAIGPPTLTSAREIQFGLKLTW
jgi:Carboxypeptidase regulatory-like domain/TonB dependent receptor-like, beta-barrel